MKKQFLASFGLFMLLVGCDLHMHPYADYLQQSVGQNDHDAIAKKLGAPHRTVKLDKGGDLWTYEFCPSGSYLGSGQCQQLNLTFDQSGTLTEWSEN